MTTLTEPLTATTALQFIRDQAGLGDWETVGDAHNNRLRKGARIYDLDAGYATNAIWVRLTVRRAGKPNSTELGHWQTAEYSANKVVAILRALAAELDRHEARIAGEETDQWQ